MRAVEGLVKKGCGESKFLDGKDDRGKEGGKKENGKLEVRLF